MAQNNLFPVEEFKKKIKSKKSEENIQLEVCAYLKTAYPHVIFFCDMASGMKMPIWLAARNKKMRSSRGLPDLFIAHTKFLKTFTGDLAGVKCGLFIELKKEGTRLQKKDGVNSLFTPQNLHQNIFFV